jgi:hypothetical protein
MQWGMAKPYVEDKANPGHIYPKKGELPALWNGYARAWEQRESLLPHIEHGVFPDRLFAKRAPNQTQEEFQYVKENYRQVTLPVYLDLENTVGRALNPHNWAIRWEDAPETETVREYVTSGIKEWGSIEAYLRNVMVRLKITDPMGLLAFFPSEVPAMENEEGELVVDPDGEIRPEIHYFTCMHVWGFEYDRWYLVRAHHSSRVEYGGKVVNEGVVCYLIDDQNVWKFEQVGKKIDWQFTITQEFTHGTGEAPCIHLGGVPVVLNGSLFFESPYLAVKEPLDIALTDAQFLQVSKVKCVYPHTVMVGDPCDFVHKDTGAMCIGGKLEWSDADGILRSSKCPECGGMGQKKRLSPQGVLLVNTAAKLDGQGDGLNASNALAFVSPSTETVAFIRSEVEHNIRHARSVLHLDADGPMAGGDAKTATEAGLNNRAKDALVKPIADGILGIGEFAIRMMGRMIAGPSWSGFSLRRPTSYDLRTEADRIHEIGQAEEKGLPPAVIDQMEMDLIAAKYTNDPEMREAMDVIMRADRLARMSPETITSEAAAGRVQAWEILLHYGGLDIYEQLTAQDAAFAASQDLWERVGMIHAKARELAAANAPAPAAPRSGPMDRLQAVLNA